MTLRQHTPFELGWMAGLRGDDPRTCPFDKMTQEWREWNRALNWACSLYSADGEEVREKK